MRDGRADRSGYALWLLLILASGGAGAGLVLLGRAEPRARVWTVAHIEVAGNRTLARADLLSSADLREGMNWWDVSSRCERALERLEPRIARASLHWAPPRGLELRVVEREPLLRFAAPSEGHVFDLSGDGVVLRSHSVLDPVDLPLLSGEFPSGHAADSAFELPLDPSWLEHLASVRDHSPALWQSISEIQYLGEEGFAVYLRPGHRVLLWDPAVNAELWAHLPKILDDLDGWNIDDAVLELRFRDQVVVRPAPGQMPPREDPGTGEEENAA